MDAPRPESLGPSPEQLRYAAVLEKGMLLGLAVLFITFLPYATGLMEPYVPLQQFPDCCRLGVEHYLHDNEIAGGWSWLGMLGYGDFLNFLGIAILALVTIVCYVLTIPVLRRSGDGIYVILAVVQVIVLCVAASGLLGAAGH